MGNFNYLGKDWSDIVFEGRNKMYGAYKLRKDDIKNTTLALVLGIGSLSLVFGGGSYLYAMNNNNERVIIIDNNPLTPIDDTDLFKKDEKPVEKNIIDETPKTVSEKQISSARTDVQENIKFTETKIVDANKNTETLASQDMFNDATNAGVTNSDADLNNGKLKADGSVTGLATEGEEGKNRNTTEVTTNTADDKIYVLKQNTAEPKEGFTKFYNNFAKKFASQDINSNANEIVVKVKFVVEKDGSFSNIEIVDDKFGVGKEAERVLKNMPKWKAASHNGKNVRSMFTLPIKIQLK